MKWFMAIYGGGDEFQHYAAMAKVAVDSARRNTGLEAFLVYDGVENDLTAWMRGNGVTILPCRTHLFDLLKVFAEKKGDPAYLNIGAATFLRLEIPALMAQQGMLDEHFLYTDCDVQFLREVEDALAGVKPRWFASASELRHTPRLFNAGVMVMNAANLRKVDARLRKFTARHVATFARGTWDQDALREYFVLGPRVVGDGRWARFCRRITRPRWDSLPLEFNWRPYWEKNPEARIIHFHGPKPHQKAELLSGNPHPRLVPLLQLTGGEYLNLTAAWEEAYRLIS